ncbi:9587_t:CDS:2 [Paraglomus brasilianum]|uniref:9587_t:CDS:1 n=1 Tax=Paraglomus brasilianum TaxID=144538 RepID=A0A9N9G2A0_9GLOM|nr:9587_t:CDS:2 [Paraglomus brasilianum]
MVQEQGGVITGMNPSHYNASDPIVIFIIQVILIVAVTRCLDLVLSKLLQPRVISEVLGGIILGPSVLGHIPGYTDAIFPPESIPQLTLIANIGLVLYLFLVGVELDPRMVLKQAKLSISISAVGMALPFGLGVAVSYGLYQINHPGVPIAFGTFLLFMGVAISITAFPVLARIITELKLTQTRIGSTALCSAVGDDITAWVLLALVVTIVNASSSLTALYVFLLAIAWGLILIYLVRPLLLKLIIKTNSHTNGPTVPMMAFTLLLFFAISGLKTQIGLLNDGAAWGYVFLVIFVAMFGKVSGCTLVARAYGIPWREALTVGVFMSCKGLVELIVLNIGLNAKVIDPKVFAILVVMAIVTTCITAPLAILIGPDDLKLYKSQIPYFGKKLLAKDDEESGGTYIPSTKSKNNILVVLNKVEYISPMMSLLRLLQPTQSDVSTRDSASVSSDEKIAVKHTGDQEAITVHALRLMELGQRMSSVMKSHESAEIAHHDPIMNVFRIFGEQNIFNVESTLSIRAVNKFAEQVLQTAEQSSAELIIIPWTGTGSIAYDNPEDFYHPREYSDTNPQVAQYVQEVFNATENISVTAFIDRGLGMVPGGIPVTGKIEIKISMFVPFVAGADDREALSLVARFVESPYVEATVLRIIKSDEPTEYDSQLEPVPPAVKKDEINTPHRPPISATINPMSSNSIAVINYSTVDRIESNAADELHVNKYFGPRGSLTNNPRVKYSELKASTPMQTAVQHAKNLVGRKDLVIVGRGQRNVSYSHRDEWMEMIRHLGIGGNDIRKSLGEMAASMLSGGIQASVLVVQGKKEKRK